jgi:hypothetical protein
MGIDAIKGKVSEKGTGVLFNRTNHKTVIIIHIFSLCYQNGVYQKYVVIYC